MGPDVETELQDVAPKTGLTSGRSTRLRDGPRVYEQEMREAISVGEQLRLKEWHRHLPKGTLMVVTKASDKTFAPLEVEAEGRDGVFYVNAGKTEMVHGTHVRTL